MTNECAISIGPRSPALEVLKIVQEELLDFKGTGMSILEISHRSPEFEEVNKAAMDLMREIMGLPQSYKVLFLGGGASLQFTMVRRTSSPKAKPRPTSTPANGRRRLSRKRRRSQRQCPGVEQGAEVRLHSQGHQDAAGCRLPAPDLEQHHLRHAVPNFPDAAACRSSATCPRTSCPGDATSRSSR